MEVQEVIEESWASGEQTIDIGKHFPGFPYIMNFCNLTQVRSNNGVVRPIRRIPQAAYPMIKLTQAEIASMIHRKEERKRFLKEIQEKRAENLANLHQKNKKKLTNGKKAVKNLMSSIFHHNQKSNNLKKSAQLSSSAHNLTTASNTSSPFKHPVQPLQHPRQQQHHHYRRMPESSFSDATSSIVRRPSVDTISTYLSHEQQHHHRRTHSSYYGGSLGSQEMVRNDPTYLPAANMNYMYVIRALNYTK